METCSFVLFSEHHDFLNEAKLQCAVVYPPELTVKGIVHPKCKLLSSFTHPYIVPKLHDFLSSLMLFWTSLAFILKIITFCDISHLSTSLVTFASYRCKDTREAHGMEV